MLRWCHVSQFVERHIDLNSKSLEKRCKECQVDSVETLIKETVPSQIVSDTLEGMSEALTEQELLNHLSDLADKNKQKTNLIGQGYSETVVPPVVQRNILENPGWYTQYTPYQAEISQGRLEALLNFQTMVSDLTGLPLANASLLDEATAAAEAMLMLFRTRPKTKKDATTFYLAGEIFPQTVAVIQTRATPLGIQIESGEVKDLSDRPDVFGVILQYPDDRGNVGSYRDWVDGCHKQDIQVVVATDLLSLTLLEAPGAWGADVVVGNSQRFGVPLGFGGPHAGFFATHEAYQRSIPGRIIGVSKDRNGDIAYRMALQTREQHIRRDKATSNICTAQALLAIMAGFYAAYHGQKGLREIGQHCHDLARRFEQGIKSLGLTQENTVYFDTLSISVTEYLADQLLTATCEGGYNLRRSAKTRLQISFAEPHQVSDVDAVLEIFAKVLSLKVENEEPELTERIPADLQRKTPYLTHSVFTAYHTETEMMRYMKMLENKDLSLATAMIPLGSCTMKLNAAVEMMPLSWRRFSRIHPFAPADQSQGYREMIRQLEVDLAQITGFAACSLQPNSGAQGEYAGLLTIAAYHEANGEGHRNIVLIPTSAHGTNPASAALVGLKIVPIKCDENGNIDLDDLKGKAEKHREHLSSLMVTYPSTHGVFETHIKDICQVVHDNGGQVYMDGANMNAQVGITSPGSIGADVCHLNLHKTFAIPHGGGGPGMGPICVAEHLAKHLPKHPCENLGHSEGCGAVSAAPWGSAMILLISYAYIRLLGRKGLKTATEIAILNANYIKNRLQDHYTVLYLGENGRVAHELIIDLRGFKKSAKIEVEDVAKRLVDYGFHAPTMSWPVPGTLMIEPTESESVAEIDRFCDSLISIRKEIADIENGAIKVEESPLKLAPHTVHELADEWTKAYSRETAVFPIESIRAKKFWPSVARVDNVFGDRNLMCSCPSVEELASLDAD